jgi:hypothetical protein
MVAIAFYSIPEETAPFKLHSRYFALAIVFIMAMVQVLFLVIQTLPSKPWLLRQLLTWRGRVASIYLSVMKRAAAGGQEPAVVSSGTNLV